MSHIMFVQILCRRLSQVSFFVGEPVLNSSLREVMCPRFAAIWPEFGGTVEASKDLKAFQLTPSRTKSTCHADNLVKTS